jgi:hypothetical protein
MTKQEFLFGALFNGIDEPLKFIPVTDEQRFMFQHEMEFPDINLIKAESIESVLADIGKRRVDFVKSELLNTVRPKKVKTTKNSRKVRRRGLTAPQRGGPSIAGTLFNMT